MQIADMQCRVVQEDEYGDKGVKVGLSFADDEGANRFEITRKHVENSVSLCSGNGTPFSERVDREGASMVKFKGKCVPTEQDEEWHWQDEADTPRTLTMSARAKRCAQSLDIFGEFETNGLPVHALLSHMRPTGNTELPRKASPTRNAPSTPQVKCPFFFFFVRV